MKSDRSFLIISLIFVAVLYTVCRMIWGAHCAGSFLIGFVAAVADAYALSRMVRSVLTTGAGWLFVPLGIFRWIVAGTIVFAGFYFYEAEPVPLIAGIAVPFACLIANSIYYLLRGNRNGASA